MVGVNVDKKRTDADKFLAQIPASFTIAFDEAGTTPSAYGVKGMPSSYLIDAPATVTLRRARLPRRAARPSSSSDVAALVAKN